MPIPDYQTLMLPLLKVLGDEADHAAGSVIDQLTDQYRLTSEERAQLVGSQSTTLMGMSLILECISRREPIGRPETTQKRKSERTRRPVN